MESGLGGEREASTAVERTLKSRFDGRYRDVWSLPLSKTPPLSQHSQLQCFVTAVFDLSEPIVRVH